MNTANNNNNTWTTVTRSFRGWSEETTTSHMPSAFSKDRGAPGNEEYNRRESIRQANTEAEATHIAREKRAKKEQEEAERKKYSDFTAFISETSDASSNRKSVLNFSGTVKAMKAREEEAVLRAATEAVEQRTTTNFTPLGLSSSGLRMRRRYEDEEEDDLNIDNTDNKSIYSEDSDYECDGVYNTETETATQDNSDSFADTRRRGDKGIW
jgi:hypothetical protein